MKESDFIRRDPKESPILLRMVDEAVTPEDWEKIHAYAEKIEKFRDTGEVVLTKLPYEGPDLSPGADRPNFMAKGSTRPVRRIYGPDGSPGGGRKVVELIPKDGDEVY